jgi:hypothetical protein
MAAQVWSSPVRKLRELSQCIIAKLKLNSRVNVQSVVLVVKTSLVCSSFVHLLWHAGTGTQFAQVIAYEVI